MAWLSLIISGLFETFAVTMINRLSIKRSYQTVLFIILGLGLALAFLSYSLQTIPMGTGYAIWTGISVVCSSLIGMFYFNESKSILRIVFITLILSCAIGLKLISWECKLNCVSKNAYGSYSHSFLFGRIKVTKKECD